MYCTATILQVWNTNQVWHGGQRETENWLNPHFIHHISVHFISCEQLIHVQSLDGPLFKHSGSSLHLDDTVWKYYLALVLADIVSTLSTDCHPPIVFCVACVSAQSKNAMPTNISPGISMWIRSRISGFLKVFQTCCSYIDSLKMWNETRVDWNSTVIALHDLCCLSASV